jgi:FMN phosphatase YigB (HAD superfamily)
MKIIYVDIDETICHTPSNPRNYYLSIPRLDMIKKINDLYDANNTIVYWTARGSQSGKDWHEHTQNQLESWGAKYHELRCDKPYYDVFYDDRTDRIENL